MTYFTAAWLKDAMYKESGREIDVRVLPVPEEWSPCEICLVYF